VLEHEGLVVDAHARLGGAGIICVLQQLGDDVPGTLNLLEELVPRTGKLRVSVKLIPAPSRLIANALEVDR
jgi:hypothetical protein